MSRRAIVAFLIGFVAILCLHGTVWAQKMVPPKPKKSTSAATETPLPQTPEQVDAYLAGMTDEQARKAFSRTLKQQLAEKEGAGGGVRRGLDAGLGLRFERLVEAVSAARQKLRGTVAGAEADSEDTLEQAWEKVTAGGGLRSFTLTLVRLGAILAVGFLARRLYFRATRDLGTWMATSVRLGRLEFLGRVLSHVLLQALGLAVFGAVSFVLFVLLFSKGDPGYALAAVYVVVTYHLLLFAFGARILFAPGAPALRLFPMSEETARIVHRWLIVIVLGASLVAGASLVLLEVGAGRSAFLLTYSLSGVYFTLTLLVLIWSCRKPVAQALQPKETGSAGGALNALARLWHLPASVYVIGMGLFWVSDVLTGGDVRVVDLGLSLFVIPIAIGIDIWGQRLLKMATGESIEVVDLSGDQVREVPPVGRTRDFKSYVPLIRRLFRMTLFAFTFFVLIDLWGVEWSLGRIFTSHVLSIVIALLLGFILWEFIKARIDARLRQEMPMAGEDQDEGGGAGSRIGTLLLLLRKFVLTVLVVIVALIVLSSLGVNIGPLIAGAGVIGLAIGFGAQTLVRDIIAGVFFLIDDSFRIGDYVESTGVKGMVEQISLRSIKLRHPRGMVYTIPFGNLRSITNFSRDYTITKLDIRVGFDTDLEKVRKVIKKINKALRQDEETNKVMLDDLKSQGVKEFDDSSMIVRVKFKTLPGEQFVVRKEVYRMIQAEFRAAGIEFASRNVTVYVPPVRPLPGKGETADPGVLQAGAAAGLSLIQQEEELKRKAAAEKPKTD